MSFAVHFVSAQNAAAPHPLGDPETDLPDDDADDDPEELTADEIATWDGLHPRLVELLPAGAHDVHYYAQAVHPGRYLAPPATAELMYGRARRTDQRER